MDLAVDVMRTHLLGSNDSVLMLDSSWSHLLQLHSEHLDHSKSSFTLVSSLMPWLTWLRNVLRFITQLLLQGMLMLLESEVWETTLGLARGRCWSRPLGVRRDPEQPARWWCDADSLGARRLLVWSRLKVQV